jgi:TolB-like protein/AraC-like DNA-binding protein
MDESLSPDQAFINKLTDIILANLTNENFGVEELCRIVGMSHTTIHRKLKLITHRSLSHFICEVRLQKAYGMLQQNMGTISEISFRVGFGSPTYFDKCFHEYFGFRPGDVKRKILPEKADPAKPQTVTEPATDRLISERENELHRGESPDRKRVVIISGMAILVCSISIFWISVNRSDRPSKDLSIIVLPFKNLSDNPDNQYFADALMDDILNSLFQVSELSVISRTTSEHFRGTHSTSAEIAKEAKAHYVMEGNVRGQGDMIRITIQLIDAIQDRHIWSAIYEQKVTEITDIQNDIALNVALKLNIVHTEPEMKRIKSTPAQFSGSVE